MSTYHVALDTYGALAPSSSTARRDGRRLIGTRIAITDRAGWLEGARLQWQLVSAYRDRPLQCPRCTRELRRDAGRDAGRDVWTCEPCRGLLFGVGELIAELLKVAPGLLPAEGGVRSITTIGRRTSEPRLSCPTCAAAMEPVFLGGVELDRCYHDELIWFDRGELALVVDRAREQESEVGALVSLWRRLVS